MKTNKSRVSSGTFKGMSIYYPEVEGTRPTKNIVKESAINTLRTELPYHAFVEVFAGSGSVGIEALSNGSQWAYFLEKEKEPAKVLQSNLRSLKCENYEIIQGDSFETIKKVVKDLVERNEQAIFYLDPPFSIREGQEDVYDKTFALMADLPAQVAPIVVIEHLSSYRFEEQVGSFKQGKTKRFGKTSLTYYYPDME